MGSWRISNRDILFRHVVYPAGFRGKAKLFEPAKFIRLEEKDGKIVTSLAWQKFLPTTVAMNAYGCNLARKRNERAKAKSPGKSTQHVYAGAYALVADSIRKISTDSNITDLKNVEVFHLIEDGEIAHVELSFEIYPSAMDDQALRTILVDRIWSICYGPVRHVFQEDEFLTEHPSDSLTPAPRGDYRDLRTGLQLLYDRCLYKLIMTPWVLRYYFGLQSSD